MKKIIIYLSSLICLLLALYYTTNGHYHYLTFNGAPYDAQYKHALLLLIIAFIIYIFGRAWINSAKTGGSKNVDKTAKEEENNESKD